MMKINVMLIYNNIELASIQENESFEILIEMVKSKLVELIKAGQINNFVNKKQFLETSNINQENATIWIDEEENKKVRKNITIPQSLDRLVKATQLNLSAFVTDELRKRFCL